MNTSIISRKVAWGFPAEVLVFLRRFLTSRHGGRGVLQRDALSPLERLFEDAGYVDPTIPRVLITGVFKSGKSTLINALTAREIAPADVFEMTSWLARYWPTQETFCRVWPKYGDSQRLELDSFLERCRRRTFSSEELAEIDHVDIGLSDSPIRVTLIDAPGMGSTNRDNEKRLLTALQDADLVAWVVDVNGLGDIREAAFIQRLLSDSVPLIVILTKCDTVGSASELREIRSWLGAEFNLKGVPIFETSAIVARVPNSGVEALRSHLNAEVLAQTKVNRTKAAQAHLGRMLELAGRHLCTVEDELKACSQRVNNFASVAAQMRESVQRQLEHHIREVVATNLFGDRRDELQNRLAEALKLSKDALSPNKLTAIFESVLGQAYLDSFWQTTMAGVSKQATLLWMESLRSHEAELRDCLESVQARAAAELTADFSPEALSGRVDAIAAEAFGTAAAASLGVAGVATVWAAALGPHAASITLGAAASGIGIPIALMGLAVSAGMYVWKHNEAERIVKSRAQEILQQYTKSVLHDIIEPHVFPELRRINCRIEHEMFSAFVDAQAGGLPEAPLDDLLKSAAECRRFLAEAAVR